jgi:hypothetical protein
VSKQDTLYLFTLVEIGGKEGDPIVTISAQ